MTYARSEASGKDEFFQFIVPKAKITSENTITLEAEGDPSVFNLNLRVLRPIDGRMMQLVKYNLEDGTPATEGATTDVIHNHNMVAESSVGALAIDGTAKTVTGILATDQVVFDTDVIASAVPGAGTLTLTAASGAQVGDSCAVTIFDKDGKYKSSFKAVVPES